ncbi:MAG: hypothetical protein WBV46_14030 [Terriglobales bacterium]|jgi:hypothetical protein
MMALSVHDNVLVSYEVRCEEQTIILRSEYRVDGKPTEFTNVLFGGVCAYHFQNDAFGNIIFDVYEIPLEEFVNRYGAELFELDQMTGSLGKWVEALDSAPTHMREKEIKGFELSSSLGLCGWILAKDMTISPA